MPSKDSAASPTSLPISPTTLSHTSTTTTGSPPPLPRFFRLSDSSEVFRLEGADSLNSVAGVSSLGSGDLPFPSDSWVEKINAGLEIENLSDQMAD